MTIVESCDACCFAGCWQAARQMREASRQICIFMNPVLKTDVNYHFCKYWSASVER